MSKEFVDGKGKNLYLGYETDEIVANPELDGTEVPLTSLKLGNTKYKIEGIGSSNFDAIDMLNKCSEYQTSVELELKENNSNPNISVDYVFTLNNETKQKFKTFLSKYVDLNYKMGDVYIQLFTPHLSLSISIGSGIDIFGENYYPSYDENTTISELIDAVFSLPSLDSDVYLHYLNNLDNMMSSYIMVMYNGVTHYSRYDALELLKILTPVIGYNNVAM